MSEYAKKATDIVMDETSNKIVFGYIHIIEESVLLHKQYVPMEIIYLCALYYVTYACGDDIHLSYNGLNTLCKMENIIKWRSIFGLFVVNVNKCSESIIEWKIKTYINTSCIAIGLISKMDDAINNIELNKSFGKYRGERFILFYGGSKRNMCSISTSNKSSTKINKIKHDEIYVDGTNTIRMVLDIKNKSLKYFLNDSNGYIGFENCIWSQKYQFALSLFGKSCIEIMDIKITANDNGKQDNQLFRIRPDGFWNDHDIEEVEQEMLNQLKLLQQQSNINQL